MHSQGHSFDIKEWTNIRKGEYDKFPAQSACAKDTRSHCTPLFTVLHAALETKHYLALETRIS
jgi:hypothetical protein